AVVEAMRADARLRAVPVVVVSARGESADRPLSAMIGFSRPGGLTTGEMMGCLKSCFDALRAPPVPRSSPAPPAAPAGLPASVAGGPRRGTAPARRHAAPSR